MRSRASAMVVPLLLASCAATPADQPSSLYVRPAAAVDDGTAGGSAGRWAVSIIGTPFYFAFKGAVCAASVVVAGPAAGLFALSPTYRDDALAALGEGLSTNCGPPYVLKPSTIG